MFNLYKDILNSVPTAVIVVDNRFRVRYTNRAFRDCFRSPKERGSLRDILACGERSCVCGEGVRCGYCALRNVFLDAAENGGSAFRNLVLRGGDGGELSFRFKVSPLGKYLLGVVDNAYQNEIAQEMVSARGIQQRLLPPAKGLGGTQYSFMYIPCREIGGDLPDVYAVNGETMGLIADVSGKGISAGMLSAFVKAAWDKGEPSPSRAITGLSLKFQALNLDERSYVTAAAVRIDGERKKIFYSVAGHNAPLLLKNANGIDEIVMNSPPVSNWMPDYVYEDGTIGFSSGDVLVMMTDGVLESRNAADEQFGLERVESILARSQNAENFIERLKAALKEFCGTFSDDLTAMAFDL